MNSDEQAIHDTNAIWIDAVNTGDLARLIALMTDDAVFLSPGQAPLRRDEFPAMFSAAVSQSRIRCVSELEEVVVVGEVAYSRARDSLSVTPIEGGDETRLAGYRLSVWRKSPDGRWRLARDAHTLTS